jgi:hypothetical protein
VKRQTLRFFPVTGSNYLTAHASDQQIDQANALKEEAIAQKDPVKEQAGQDALEAAERLQTAQEQQQADGPQPRADAVTAEAKKTWKEKTFGRISDDRKDQARVGVPLIQR